MAHRTTQMRDYIQQALEDSGAANLRYEMRGKHPSFRFEVRCPSGVVKEGMFVFSSTPRIDKDLKIISQARKYVRTLRGADSYMDKDEIIDALVGEGHHEIIAGKIAKQYEARDQVAVEWVHRVLAS